MTSAEPLLVGLLLGACAVSAAVGEPPEAAVILAIVVLDALLGFAQEAGAERALLALAGLAPIRAEVRRDGLSRALPAADLERGEVVTVRDGDRVPADARLLDVSAWGSTSPRSPGVVPGRQARRPGGRRHGAGRAQLDALLGDRGHPRQREAILVATGVATEMGASGRWPPPPTLRRRRCSAGTPACRAPWSRSD